MSRPALLDADATSAYLGRLGCVRCGRVVDERDAFAGCPDCVSEGVAANVHPLYDLERVRPLSIRRNTSGLFRWSHLLPLGDRVEPVTLAEGDTPLLRTRRLGDELGLARLYVKDESRNPTWSYKDRLAAVAVTKAVELGAEVVVVATTGNHGAAAAAYAAAAGLRCVALTLASVPLTMKVLMQAYGAEVVALESGPDRWALMREAVAHRGWIPLSGLCDPPVGSNPFGVDGYKTIAYEIHEQLGTVPDVVVVPTAYADGLAGVFRGFGDLVGLGMADRIPRMVAAEPLGPYEATLAAGTDSSVRVPVRPSVAFSTATPLATYQGLHAIRSSRGVARTVGEEDEILTAQLATARAEGLYLEAAAAVCVPVVAGLRKEGLVGADDTVVVIGTSSGLKDVDATATRLPDVPVIDPSLDALDAALQASRT